MALLAALLCYGAGVRLHGIFRVKAGLTHDESISFLCAAAQEGAYQERIPFLLDTLVHVRDVIAFHDRPRQLAFRTVAKDLVFHDNHPPLYFWALHVWHHAFGLRPWSAPLFNSFLGLVLLAMLLALGLRVFGSPVPALAMAVLWYLSPAVIQIDLEGRHYQLMAVLAMASYLLGERMASGRASWGTFLLFTGINTAGMLTHYYFAALLLPGLVITMTVQGKGPALTRHMASLLLSGALFLLLFPEAVDFVKVYLGRRNEADTLPRSLYDRVRTATYASLAFFTQGHWSRYVYLGMAALFMFMTVLAVRRRGPGPLTDLGHPVGHHMATLAWASGFTLAMYMLGISPAQAVGEQYFSYFWPLVALGLVHVTRSTMPHRSWGLIFVLHALQLVLSAPMAVRCSEHVRNVLPMDWYGLIADQEMLVTDEWNRSALPRMLYHLPPGLPLFITMDGAPALDGTRHIAFLHMDPGGVSHPLTEVLRSNGWLLQERHSEGYRLLIGTR